MINVFCDGSITNGNPGGRGVSAYVIKNHNGAIMHKAAVDLGQLDVMTSNVTEFTAIKEALKKLTELNLVEEVIVVSSDSKLAINQINDEWQCTNPNLRILRDTIWHLTESFDSLSFQWIPREQNVEADALSKSLKDL